MLKVCLTLAMPSLTESCVESSWSDCGIKKIFLGFFCLAATAFAVAQIQVLRHITIILSQYKQILHSVQW